MNILFLQRRDQAGGGSRASLQTTFHALSEQRPDWALAVATQEKGPFSQAVSKYGVRHVVNTLPNYRKRLLRPFFWNACRKLSGSEYAANADAIISNEWVTAPHAYETGRRLKKNAISYVRDFAALQRGRKYQLHRMDRLLCVCESMRLAMIGVGYDPEIVRTVYNPILTPFHSEPENELLKRLAGHPNIDRWLLYLGRISPRKNQVAAVKTLELLRKQTGQRWGLILAGDVDEDYSSILDTAIAEAGLTNEVVRLGMVSKPGWLFNFAEALILTSKSEGLARILIESFLCGKPAFSYPMDGLEDIYGKEIDRFVADRCEPDDLSRKIIEAIGKGNAVAGATSDLQKAFEIRHSMQSHVMAFEQAIRIV